MHLSTFICPHARYKNVIVTNVHGHRCPLSKLYWYYIFKLLSDKMSIDAMKNAQNNYLSTIRLQKCHHHKCPSSQMSKLTHVAYSYYRGPSCPEISKLSWNLKLSWNFTHLARMSWKWLLMHNNMLQFSVLLTLSASCNHSNCLHLTTTSHYLLTLTVLSC